jgi:hypothetical protein
MIISFQEELRRKKERISAELGKEHKEKKPDFLIVVVLILQFTLHPGNVQCKPLLKYGSQLR